MRQAVAAALAACIILFGANAARGDTLIDHVDGLTLNQAGEVERFEGILVSDDGRVEKMFRRGDKRPKKVRYLMDGKGRVLIPGLILADADIMRLGLAIVLAKPSARRSEGALPTVRPRPEDLDVALAEAQQALLAAGITTTADMGTTIAHWQALRRAGDAGNLQLRVLAYAPAIDDMILIGGPGPSPWLYDDRLRFLGLSLDNAAAHNDTQLRNLMSRAAMDRFQVAVRAQTPAQLTTLLDAVAELSLTYTGERRWRAQGLVQIAPADVPRLAALGVMTTAQHTPPLAPGTLPSPFAAMADAVTSAQAATRRTRQDALADWTTRAAHAAFAETRLGRIAPGLRADFLLLGRDPMLAAAGELRAMAVLETWVNGQRVWQAASPAREEQAQPGGR